jgi:sec-independent protein translocase protein TatA
MFGIGMTEMIIIGIIGVLLFGKRLPEVGKSLGKSLVEFKRGVSGVQSEIETAVNTAATSKPRRTYDDYEDREEAAAPKFEPPPEEPKV